MRGRKPLPDALKVLRGTDQPSRMNPDKPQADADELQFIPSELSLEAQKHWAKIRPMLVDSGIANNLDRIALMQLCEEWANYLRAMQQVTDKGLLVQGPPQKIRRPNGDLVEMPGMPIRNPYWRLAQDSGAAVLKLCSEFGMTPSARQRITGSGRKPKKGGDFDDI